MDNSEKHESIRSQVRRRVASDAEMLVGDIHLWCPWHLGGVDAASISVFSLDFLCSPSISWSVRFRSKLRFKEVSSKDRISCENRQHPHERCKRFAIAKASRRNFPRSAWLYDSGVRCANMAETRLITLAALIAFSGADR